MQPSDLSGIAAAGTSSTALMKGYAGGYFSSFYRPSVKSSVTLVTSGVSLYSSSVYPRGALDRTMKNKAVILTALRKQHITSLQVRWISGVGEKALALSYSISMPAPTAGGKASKSEAIVLIFSRGKYAATLSISTKGMLSKDQALSIAKQVDDRIQHAG